MRTMYNKFSVMQIFRTKPSSWSIDISFEQPTLSHLNHNLLEDTFQICISYSLFDCHQVSLLRQEEYFFIQTLGKMPWKNLPEDWYNIFDD